MPSTYEMYKLSWTVAIESRQTETNTVAFLPSDDHKRRRQASRGSGHFQVGQRR
jgi:hypothetical protein